MADYGVIIEQTTYQVELSASTTNDHLIFLIPAVPVINDQSFQVYEQQVIGTVIGHVISSDPTNITYSIFSGNTSTRFSIDASTGILTTAAILNYNTQPTGYTLGVTVTNNLVPTLSDSAAITITVLPIYHICANNVPSFSAVTEDNLINYLHIGILQLNTGALGDYVIEWHLNSTTGTTVFISGNAGNTDINIEAYHPFFDLAQAGDLYAVVRYITVDTVKYSAYPFSSYGLYSPDLVACLGHKTVASMNCNNASVGVWGHSISYVNTSMGRDAATRSLSYLLNTDGSTKYISYYFAGYLIADRITTKYCTTGGTQTIIDDWAVGTDCTGNTFTGSPKLFVSQTLKRTLGLTGFTYSSGDFLLFNIFPSYNAPSNTDTNWQLLIKCWAQGVDLPDLEFQPNTVNDINTGVTISLVYNTGNCTYDVTLQTGNPRPGVEQGYNSEMYYYTQASGAGSWDWTSGQTIQLLNYSGASFTYAPQYFGTPYLLNGQLNISLTASTHSLVYTFTNSTDYNNYKSGYNASVADSHWTNWTSNVNSINHYKFFYDVFKVSMTSGDTFNTYGLYIDHDSTFVFDDANKIITITLTPQSDQYSGVTCDKTASDISIWIGYINTIYSGTTWNFNTIWGTQYPFSFLYAYPYAYAMTSQTMQTYFFISDDLLDSSTPLPPEWFLQSGTWFFYKIYAKVTIDNIADPLNNYSVYTALKQDGTINYSPFPTINWILIKQVP